MPNSSDWARPTARPSDAWLGWSSCWSRTPRVAGATRRPASSSRIPRSSLPHARHPPRDGRPASPARRARLRRNPPGIRGHAQSAAFALQRATRPRAPARRSGRRRTIPPRRPRPCDPLGKGDQSRPGPTWTRLERSLPCSRAPDAPRGPERARLRPEQRSQASSCDARAGSVLVGPVVRRMECHAGASGRNGAHRSAPDVARARRLAKARPHPRRRGAPCCSHST
jgi:hypothetical protein